MSNYQDENSGPYETPGAGTGPYAGPYQATQPGGLSGGAAPQGDGGHQYDTQHFGTAQAPQQWQGQPGYQGNANQGHFGSGRSSRPSINVRPTFKTTEFWVLVIVGIALLIAAAVTDRGADNQGFGAQEAWKYVTALAVAYIISRGLTKFGGHERDDHDHRNR